MLEAVEVVLVLAQAEVGEQVVAVLVVLVQIVEQTELLT
jgi:hypothetical protein